ncbi:phage tail protein [Aeromonas hydrophila]|uniref:phage tail-collar fiber domain-containing protein n=1 Tax=Aeromonas hydrophila TaxID=644 RepID=UPI0009BF34DC|nr:phage tail protein [Aeromonas hydrophila]
MSQVITNAFEQYWQSCLTTEQPVVMDEFILADIPNLDITSPIDPETGLPPQSQIVHRQNVDQRGRINNNAVAYTIVMDTTVGDFSFNAMYLRNKQLGVIGMIVYKGRETKLKTDQTTGQTGNSLVKSMLMGYDQAAEATLTNVDAGTWQIDYAARLRGMDEDIRQLQADLYGHHTFVGDGFKVVEQDGAYQVTKGVAIIGGLRVELKAPEVIHPGTKPIGVWVDVHRSGSLLSEHQNHFTIITSVADLTDHVDNNGYQHYVAKLGAILADSTIVDGRGNTGNGETSIHETLVRLEQTDDLLFVNTFEVHRRSYGEAGFNVVGTFEEGFTYVNAHDIGIHKATGKGYTGPAGDVVAGTDPASGGFVDRSGELLRKQLVLTSAEAKKKTNYTEGQPVYLIDLGCRFVFRKSRYLIVGQAESEITFDDDLHILIDAGGMLQFDDFSKVRAKQTINAARFAAALKDDTTTLSIDCYGDSITFGQAKENSPGATNEIGSPTGFGDGSTHNHWRFNSHYPQWVASFLANNLLQASHVNNFGYSGDRAISGYLRHRVTSGSLAATIMYGINDCNFATSNGSLQSGLSGPNTYSVQNYAVALRLFAAKQIMQGKYVTIMGTTPFAGQKGFDGTKLASSQLARAYNAAAKQVAAEFGCRYVDMCQDVFAQYGLMEITDDGTHLGPAGLKIAGSRISAALFTLDTENRVSHGSVLLANPMINNRMSRSQSNVLPNITSSTPKGTLDNKPTTMAVGSDFLTIPFYAETGGLVVFVNGVVAASGAVMDIQIDSGALQSDFHFQHDFMPGKPVSAKSVTRNAPFHRDNTNISDPTGPFFIVANRGWHTLSIRKAAGESTPNVDSLSFESLESVLASDVNGVSATAVWADGGYDATASRGIASMSVPYQGGIQVTFKTPRVNDTYTVAVTATFPGTGVMYRVMRLTTGFTVEFLYGSGAGAGMEFNPETPTDATFAVIGGR